MRVILPLHAENPGAMTGAGNWTYLLTGKAPVLIDAGVGASAHIGAIERARPSGPAHVLVTHAHSDHISGATALAARWPHTRFSKMTWPERDAAVPVPWNELRDGDVVAAGDGELRVVHTPGHAPDHVAFWDASTRTLFSGDLVVAGTTVVIPASAGGSLAAYLQSLQRVLTLGAEKLLPAHGDAIDDPGRIVREYIAHRRQREEQVLSALADGAGTMAAIVSRIYVGLSDALVPMACESVLAHLQKLKDEGLATTDGEHWTLC